jgi:UDPglucose--hexose-1-phosphate uridylyltransferase
MHIAQTNHGEVVLLAELRRHPVSGEWVVICPEKSTLISSDGGDGCIYCPGNETRTGQEILRVGANGSTGGSDWKVRVVAESPPLFHVEGDFGKKAAGICDRMEAIGAHEIVVESPYHDIEFEDLDDAQTYRLLDTLRMRSEDLSKDRRLRQVLIFKVRSLTPECPRSHPTWHIVSTPFVPALIKQELNGSREYFAYKERCVLCDYIREELRVKARVIHEDSEAIAVSPYSARFPFEVWVLPLSHSPDFRSIRPEEISGVGRVLKRVIGGLKRLPNSEGYIVSIHTAPYRKPKADAWKTLDLDYHWHVQIRPRVDLLNGLKESGGFHLNPIPPEEAAKTIAALC